MGRLVPEGVKRFIRKVDDIVPNWSERRFANHVVRRHSQAGDIEPITITGDYRTRTHVVSAPHVYGTVIDSVILSLNHDQSGRRPIQYSREISSAETGELPPPGEIWEMARTRAKSVGEKITRRGATVNVTLFGVPLTS